VSFRESVSAGETLLLDGGMGSALLARGLAHGSPPELWNLERGEVIGEIHREFVAAGSDAVQTNTFGGNPIRLRNFGLDARCEEINRAAVALARAANPRFVIGDVGPTGEYLPPVGSGDAQNWRRAFSRQAKALADAGIDAFHVETMSDMSEALVALEALNTVAPTIPIMVSMTFEKKSRGFFTVMGNPLVSTLASLLERGAFAVGANCSIESDVMRDLMREARRAIDAPLVAQPNAGTPEAGSEGGWHYAQDPEEFAADMIAILEDAGGVGRWIVGGCCGTDRRFISALRDRLREAGR